MKLPDKEKSNEKISEDVEEPIAETIEINLDYFIESEEIIEELLRKKDIKELINFLRSNEDELVDVSIKNALTKMGESVTEHLIPLLSDRNSKLRIAAADVLGRIGSDKAVEPLINTLLNDKNSDVRISAAEALGRLKNERAIIPLIKALEDENVQWDAARALVEIGKPAVDVLIQVLENKNSNARYLAAWALGKIGDPKAVEPLIKSLKDKSVRSKALIALVDIGKKDIESIIKYLQSEDKAIREDITWILGQIKNKRAVDPLICVLTNKDEYASVRASAAMALGEIGDEKAVKPLIDALSDEYATVRSAAALALGGIGDKIAVERLINALNDESPQVQKNAAMALGMIGDPKALEPLNQALEHATGYFREFIEQAIDRIKFIELCGEKILELVEECCKLANELERPYDKDELIRIAKEHYDYIVSNVGEDEALKNVRELLTWELGLKKVEYVGGKPKCPFCGRVLNPIDDELWECEECEYLFEIDEHGYFLEKEKIEF